MSRILYKTLSCVLLIAVYGHDICHDCKYCQCRCLDGDVSECPAFNEHRAHSVDKIFHRIYRRDADSPVGHGADRCEQSAEQNHAHHDKPHDKHRLLHRTAVVAYHQSYAAESQREQHCQHIEQQDVSFGSDAVNDP